MSRNGPPAPPTKFGSAGSMQAKLAGDRGAAGRLGPAAGHAGIPPPAIAWPGRKTPLQAKASLPALQLQVVQRMLVAAPKSRVWHCNTCAGVGTDESFDYGYAEVAPAWACTAGHIAWQAGPSPAAPPLPAPAPILQAPVVHYPFPQSVPRYVYRWCTKKAAKAAVQNGITKTGGVHGGIPTLVQPMDKRTAEGGGGIGIVSAEACLRIDTSQIPEIAQRQANSVNIVKGRGNTEAKILVDIPAGAIEIV